MSEFYWIAKPDTLKEQIVRAERLSTALWRLFPAFVHPSALERMGLSNLEDAFLTARGALRDFLCCELEQKLKALEANPLPPPTEMRMMQIRRPKPPIETLISAQEAVSRIEHALA